MSGLLLKPVVATAAGFFVGKYFYSTYKNRRLYYLGMVDFIAALTNNLSFRQEKLPVLVREFSVGTNSVFKSQLDAFSAYISEGKPFTVTCKHVKNDIAAIENFFKNVGTVDLFTQKEALNAYKSDFTDKFKKSEEDLKNKGMAYLKLSTLAGLAAGILLL